MLSRTLRLAPIPTIELETKNKLNSFQIKNPIWCCDIYQLLNNKLQQIYINNNIMIIVKGI